VYWRKGIDIHDDSPCGPGDLASPPHTGSVDQLQKLIKLSIHGQSLWLRAIAALILFLPLTLSMNPQVEVEGVG
jgi:hypothetical protein